MCNKRPNPYCVRQLCRANCKMQYIDIFLISNTSLVYFLFSDDKLTLAVKQNHWQKCAFILEQHFRLLYPYRHDLFAGTGYCFPKQMLYCFRQCHERAESYNNDNTEIFIRVGCFPSHSHCTYNEYRCYYLAVITQWPKSTLFIWFQHWHQSMCHVDVIYGPTFSKPLGIFYCHIQFLI